MYFKRYSEKNNKDLVVRVLKKTLALNGAKRYLIADFPQS